MITVKIIAMVWSLVMSAIVLVAKMDGLGALGTLVVKLLSFITLLWAGLELLLILP